MNGTMLGVDSRIAFTVVIVIIALQRLWELGVSKRHLHALKARGGFEVGTGHYPWMVALHTAFLVSCVAEGWLLDRPWRPLVAGFAVLILGAAMALRWWTLATLGERWTTRVVVVPGEALGSSGPYRWLRHPNYLVVVIDSAAIPMIHCAGLTAVVCTIANLVLLRERIRIEDGALSRLAAGGNG